MAGGLPARARLFGARAAARRRSPARAPHQRHRRGRRARGRVLHPLRLRAAVLPEPRRGRRALMAAARATRRAFSPRRLRPPSGCGRTARRASAWCSSAAKSAAATARRRPTASPRRRSFLINGEPTDLRLGAATRGVFRVRLTATRQGRALRLSGARRVGDRQADRLPDGAARRATGPSDPLLGTTHYTVGLINGGVAPNVIPPHAEAEVFFRTVGDHAPLRADAARRRSPAASRWRRSSSCRRCGMHTVPGFETAVFSYFSDIPFLSNWGTPLLLGPGSIHVAHTDREHIAIDELDRAVEIYAKLAHAAVVVAESRHLTRSTLVPSRLIAHGRNCVRLRFGPEPRQSQGGESRQGRKAAALSRFRDVLRTSGPSSST